MSLTLSNPAAGSQIPKHNIQVNGTATSNSPVKVRLGNQVSGYQSNTSNPVTPIQDGKLFTWSLTFSPNPAPNSGAGYSLAAFNANGDANHHDQLVVS
jgi:hypothetical protein